MKRYILSIKGGLFNFWVCWLRGGVFSQLTIELHPSCCLITPPRHWFKRCKKNRRRCVKIFGLARGKTLCMPLVDINVLVYFIRLKDGTIGCLLQLSPRFYNNVFLYVGLATLLTSIKFCFIVLLNVSTTNCNLLKGNFMSYHWGWTSIYRS